MQVILQHPDQLDHIDSGVNLNARDEYGRTPLLYAAERGYIAVAKVLLENKADVNARDRM